MSVTTMKMKKHMTTNKAIEFIKILLHRITIGAVVSLIGAFGSFILISFILFLIWIVINIPAIALITLPFVFCYFIGYLLDAFGKVE